MAAHWAGGRAAARRFATVGALAGVIALAACAPRQKPPVAPPPPPPEKPVTVAPGELHRIAILVPLTGPNAPVGISLANAATLALVDSGRAGIRLTSYDTAQGAGLAAQRALGDGAQLILGPLLAGDAAAVKAAAEPRGVTMLSFSNDSGIAGGRLYVLGFQPAQSVTRVVEHARARGLTRFAALVPEGVYGQRASVAFTRAVQAAGGQVVNVTSFARQQPAALPAAARRVTDHEARVRQAGAADSGGVPPISFEALLIADSGATAAAFAPHLQRFGAGPGSFQLLGTELWATESGLGAVPALRGALFAAVPERRFQQMAQRYRARFGGTPSRLASLAYDATLLAASAAGGPWQAGTPFPQKLLEDPQGFAGVDGIFRFRGQVAERGLDVQQVTAGGTQTVSPAPASFR